MATDKTQVAELSPKTPGTPGKRRTKAELVDRLRRRIIRGDFAPGDRLPTRTQLVGRLGASSGTIQAAVDCLVEDGFLEAGPTGTYVSSHPPHLTDLTILFAHDPLRVGLVSQFEHALYQEGKRFAAESRRRVEFVMNVDAPASRSLANFKNDLEAHRLAGVIHTTLPFPHIANLLRSHPDVPRAAVMLPMDGLNISTVSIDSKSFYETAAEQLRLAGCRRVGLIAPVLHYHLLDQFHHSVNARGMITRPWWQHSPVIHVTHGEGIRNAVHAMMRLPRDDRPDGLILADDNQVEDATLGLIASGVRVPDEIKVVAHTNFPWPTEAHVPVIRVGFDTARVLHTCVDLIDGQRRGLTISKSTVIPAIVAEGE